MDKSRYAAGPPISGSLRGGQGAPPRGIPPPTAPYSWGLQDGRGNFAVQPVANAGTMKLKKAAVKIDQVAPVPQFQTAAPKSPAVLSPASGAKSPEGYVLLHDRDLLDGKPAELDVCSPVPAIPTPEPKTTSSQKDNGKSSGASQAVLEDLFARLNSATTSHASEGSTPVKPDKSMFAFEDRLGAASTKLKTTATTGEPVPLEKTSSVESLVEKLFLSEESKKSIQVFADADRAEKVKPDQSEAAKDTGVRDASLAHASKPVGERILVGKSQEELETEYMRKASEYMDALPVEQTSASHLIQVVSKKLCSLYSKDDKSNDSIKARFAFALANYIKKVPKKGLESCSPHSIMPILKDANGDLLKLCAKLVDEKYISLQTLDDVSGMARALLNILPKAEPSIRTLATTTIDTAVAAVESTEAAESVVVKPVSKDAVGNIKEWPAPEKRENSESTLSFSFLFSNFNTNKLQRLLSVHASSRVFPA